MHTLGQIGERLLVIYDGHCGLCNRAVRWFLRRDSFDRLRFVPSHSPKIAALLVKHGANAVTPAANASPATSILVLCNLDQPEEKLLARSDAIAALMAQLPRPWPALGVVLRLIPRPLRDLGYKIIAANRYRIWGRLEACPLPTDAERTKFL